MTWEAVASSGIEGTQTSVSEVLEANATGQSLPGSDVREVQNYIAALTEDCGVWPRSRCVSASFERSTLS